MTSKIGTFWKNNHPVIIVGGILLFSHLGWKHLQDIGIGDPGREYPHKSIPKVLKEVMSGGKSEESSNEKNIKTE